MEQGGKGDSRREIPGWERPGGVREVQGEGECVSRWGRDGRVAPCTDLATILECHVRGEKGEARTNYTVHWRERGAGVRLPG